MGVDSLAKKSFPDLLSSTRHLVIICGFLVATDAAANFAFDKSIFSGNIVDSGYASILLLGLLAYMPLRQICMCILWIHDKGFTPNISDLLSRLLPDSERDYCNPGRVSFWDLRTIAVNEDNAAALQVLREAEERFGDAYKLRRECVLFGAIAMLGVHFSQLVPSGPFTWTAYVIAACFIVFGLTYPDNDTDVYLPGNTVNKKLGKEEPQSKSYFDKH